MHGSDNDESGIQMSSLLICIGTCAWTCRITLKWKLAHPCSITCHLECQTVVHFILSCTGSAECTNCFQPLIEMKSDKNDCPVLGVMGSIQARKQVTYLHAVPLPIPITGVTPSLDEHDTQSQSLGIHFFGMFQRLCSCVLMSVLWSIHESSGNAVVTQ